MPVIPIRGAGEIGVVADLLPYDVPFNSWNSARNVRFKNKTISKSSVFKKLVVELAFSNDPIAITDASKAGFQGCLVVVSNAGTFRQLNSGVESIVSPTVPWVPTTTRVVSTRLGGVTYFSNSDNKPVYRADPAAPLFQYIPGWGASDYCVSMRAYKDFLIALNVTKNAVNYENMVKWSDVTQAGAPPPNWNVVSTSSLAGETVLNDARGKLVDAMTLGNAMMLYGSAEVYRMVYIGAPFVFAFEKVFDDLGVPSVDCVAEVDGKHYVFGKDAIYVHDGMTKVAISDSRVTNRVYSYLDQAKEGRCFVALNKMKSEVIFCYPSTNDECVWKLSDTTGCNEGVVYNYSDNTWSFIDLPSVTAVGTATLPITKTWDDLAAWNTLTNSWRSFDSAAPELTLFVSSGNSTLSTPRALYFFDDYLDGLLSNTVEDRLLWSGYVESAVKDSDEFSASLSSTKLVRSVIPQVRSISPEGNIEVSVGSAKNPNSSVNWSTVTQFNPITDYKCDFRSSGRYMLIKFGIPATVDVEISGYDLDIEVVAQR